MPAGGDPYEPDDALTPKLGLRHRFLLALPRMKQDREKAPLEDRLKKAFLKPEKPGTEARKAPAKAPSVEELERQAKSLDDKERLIGLVVAPIAAAIGFIVIHTLVVNDPPQHLRDGALNKLYVNPSTYYDLFLVLLVLAALMIVMALWRKRLYLGIVIALYGLAVFNLHYWGLGIPFLLVGSWYLVRAYRLNRDLRVATGGASSRWAAQRDRGAADAGRPQPNKRYTQPTKRSSQRGPQSKGRSSSKPENEKRAG
jgi:hypothetical protein